MKENAENGTIRSTFVKKLIWLISPFLLFFILVIPYGYINSRLIVKLFGCGCPKIDDAGNVIENYFNANTFTAYFWTFIAISVCTLSVYLAFRFIKNKYMRLAYIIAVLVLSLLLSSALTSAMMWN